MGIKIVVSFCVLIVGVFGNHIRVGPQLYVTPAEDDVQSTLGVMNGLRSCGGHGQLIQLRYETCQGSGICQIPGDGQLRQSELEFIPSEDIEALGVRFLVLVDGEVTKEFERPISESDVEGGRRYILHALGGANEDLKGKTVTIQYLIYRVEDNNVEICGEADVQVV